MTTMKTDKDNLVIYKQVDSVPQEAIKTIYAGRLKGMSDINPMWRIKVMTQVFGPCGVGWKYVIDKQWAEQYGNEVKCFCNISVFVKIDDTWSDAIQGTGGSAMVSMERNGAYVNDEAYKMALTDALSVAMKSLGVGASVYFGKDADYCTKYAFQQGAPQAPQQTSQQKPQSPAPSLSDAKSDSANIKSRDDFEVWWAKYPSLQQNQEFLAMAQELGKKFPKTKQ